MIYSLYIEKKFYYSLRKIIFNEWKSSLKSIPRISCRLIIACSPFHLGNYEGWLLERTFIIVGYFEYIMYNSFFSYNKFVTLFSPFFCYSHRKKIKGKMNTTNESICFLFPENLNKWINWSALDNHFYWNITSNTKMCPS